MEKRKKELKISKSFLKKLNVASVDNAIEWSNPNTNITIFTVLDRKDKTPVATVYQCPYILKKGAEMEEEKKGLSERLKIRQKIENNFLPKILDFEMEEMEDNINVRVLFEYIGSSFASLLTNKKLISKSVLTWINISLVELVSLMNKNIFVLNIGPELFFAKENALTLLDIDDVIHNVNWTMDISKLKISTDWRTDRVIPQIMVPQQYVQLELFMKTQVYMWAISFIYLIFGDQIFDFITTKILMPTSLFVIPTQDLISEMDSTTDTKAFEEQSKNLALILSSCTIHQPYLCPEFKEIMAFTATIEDLTSEYIKAVIRKKCANCGGKVTDMGTPSQCNNLIICRKCLKVKCVMCGETHEYSIKSEEEKSSPMIRIYEILDGTVYEIPVAGATIGRKKNNTIGTLKYYVIHVSTE